MAQSPKMVWIQIWTMNPEMVFGDFFCFCNKTEYYLPNAPRFLKAKPKSEAKLSFRPFLNEHLNNNNPMSYTIC